MFSRPEVGSGPTLNPSFTQIESVIPTFVAGASGENGESLP